MAIFKELTEDECVKEMDPLSRAINLANTAR